MLLVCHDLRQIGTNQCDSFQRDPWKCRPGSSESRHQGQLGEKSAEQGPFLFLWKKRVSPLFFPQLSGWGPSSFPADNIPVCFPFSSGPSLSGLGRVRFAFVVRLEAQNSAARRKRPCSPTVGTLHKRDTTLLKTLEVNGNHPEKRAFGWRATWGWYSNQSIRRSSNWLQNGCRTWETVPALKLGIHPEMERSAILNKSMPSTAGATIRSHASPFCGRLPLLLRSISLTKMNAI